MDLSAISPKRCSQGSVSITWLACDDVLCYASNKDWFEALRTNDKDKALDTLRQAKEDERKLLLNGRFDYDTKEDTTFASLEGKLVITRPLNIAAVYGSFDVIKILMENKADVTLVDNEHYNIFHCLIANAFFLPEQEKLMVEVYKALQDMLPHLIIQDLLLQENKLTLRPLEMAAQQGTFYLMRAIMDTNDVYLVRRHISGMYEHRCYDITEYETHEKQNRHVKSPILLIALLNKRRLSLPTSQDMFKCPVIKDWINAKITCNMLYIAIWCMLRIFYVTVLFIQDSDNGVAPLEHFSPKEDATTEQVQLIASNASGGSYTNASISRKTTGCNRYMYFHTNIYAIFAMTAYLSLHSLCILFFDFYEVVKGNYRKMPWLIHDLSGRKSFVVHYVFYRLMQFIMATLVVAGGGTVWAKVGQGNLAADLAHIMVCVSTVWSILYFVQLAPSIGHFVIVVQRMLLDMLNFTLIFIFFFIPFTHMFYRFMTSMEDCEGLSTLKVYYETFAIMLNMVDTISYMERVKDPIGYMLLHMFYVFMVAILLVNFLVALMSSSVAEVKSNKENITTIQRISVVLQLEDKLGQISFFRRFYHYNQRKNFLFEKGRIYLVKSVRR